jgi:hypothetical protein
MIDNGPDRHPAFDHYGSWQDACRRLNGDALVEGQRIQNCQKELSG